jgi:hypothetical protein
VYSVGSDFTANIAMDDEMIGISEDETYTAAHVPNQMIIWLDAHIGDPENCILLKRAFADQTDPNREIWTRLGDRDFDNLGLFDTVQTVQFEGVDFLLHACQNVDACNAAFETHRDKHIFFITSGSMGRLNVPWLLQHFPACFRDPINNQPLANIYVFCLDFALQDWIDPHQEYLQMFNHDGDLLKRLTFDVAGHFLRQSRLTQIAGPDDLRVAIRYANWAKRVQYRHDQMRAGGTTDHPVVVRPSPKALEIDRYITELENHGHHHQSEVGIDPH